MKLSEYVALLNLLDTTDISADRTEAVRVLAGVFQTIIQYKTQVQEYSEKLQDDFLLLRNSIDQFTQTVKDLREHVANIVVQHESAYLQNSIRLYQSEMIHESNEYILNRRLVAHPEDREYIVSRLKLLGDWRYPGMIIRPGLEDFIKVMVPLDPLYIVDQNHGLLEPAIVDFPELYQRRLRKYTVDDYRSDAILGKLPNNQFSTIFAWNFFNYKPLSVIERYLTEIFTKLRPGGTVIMSYNNCDRSHGVGLVESSFMTYTPLRLLKPVIEQIGYVDVNNRVCSGDFDLLEIKKPGELTTIKGGQCLAKIIADF